MDRRMIEMDGEARLNGFKRYRVRATMFVEIPGEAPARNGREACERAQRFLAELDECEMMELIHGCRMRLEAEEVEE